MRISDWSSDVCSSDLTGLDIPRLVPAIVALAAEGEGVERLRADHPRHRVGQLDFADRALFLRFQDAQDRKSVVWGKRVSVRVDLGGSRIIKKKKAQSKQSQ